MSEVSEAAKLHLSIADYAAVDQSGKVNILGAGLSGVGLEPTTGVSTRFSVVAEVVLPRSLLPAELSLEIALLDQAGEVFGIAGPGGVSQLLRVGQVHTVERAMPPAGSGMPAEAFVGRLVQILDFAGGLPLRPGGQYQWRLQVDLDEEHQILYPFAVAGPPPGPVIG